MLEWSPNGELLATCSYNGITRVWSRDRLHGMVQAWVGQKLLKCYILRVFTMSDLVNI